MANVADYVASATLLSDGSGSFTEPPYGDGFSTTTNQYTHSSGMIQRNSAGWGSFTWGTQFGSGVCQMIMLCRIGGVGEGDFILRGSDIGSSNWDGYDFYFDGSSGWEFYRVINAGGFSALATATQAMSVGDLFGFVAITNGSQIECAGAVNTGGGWGANFISYTDTSGSRLTGQGYIGSWANGTSLKIDDLYGGTAALSGGGGGSPADAFVPTKMLMGVGR